MSCGFGRRNFLKLNPRRGRSGNRTYTERNIKVILAIKDLLYGQKYTIQGAVERLKIDRSLWENQSIEGATSNIENPLVELQRMLVELKQLIEGDKTLNTEK